MKIKCNWAFILLLALLCIKGAAFADTFNTLYRVSARDTDIALSKPISKYLEDEKADTGVLPNALVWAVGSPINANGDSIVSAKDSFGTVIARASVAPLKNKAGAAIVFQNIYRNAAGRFIGTIYKWAGGITIAQSGGNSFQEVIVARNRAIRQAYTLAFYDITDLKLSLYSTSYATSGDTNGNSTFAVLAWYDPPDPLFPPDFPKGQLNLSKTVQRDDADVLVSVSNLVNVTQLSIQVDTVAPIYATGQPIGSSKPTFGYQISTGASVAQPAGTPGAVSYITLYGRGTSGDWFMLDYRTLTPYGHLSTFEFTTVDSIMAGRTRRIRYSQNPSTLLLDMSGPTRILTDDFTAAGAETGDLSMEMRINFDTPLAYLGTHYWSLTYGYISSSSSAATLKDYYSSSVASNFYTSVVVPSPSAMFSMNLTPWSKPITGASGTFPGLQLAAPIRLEVYPLAAWSASGCFVDAVTGAALTPAGTQGSLPLGSPTTTTALGNVEITGPVNISVTNPYPNSRFIVLLTDPSNTTTKIAEVDSRLSYVSAPFDLIADVLSAVTVDGNYTMRVLAMTPADRAALSTVTGPGYSESPVAGYGWMSLANITFTYSNRVTINGMILSVEQRQ